MTAGAILSLAVLCFLTLPRAEAQTLPDNLDSLAFDSSSFTEDFFAEPATSTPAWLQPFTFKLSQQVFGQVNRHVVTLADDSALRTPARMENNRLSLLTRYQNPFAPGWLLQASAQAKLYWHGDYEFRANDNRPDTEFRLNEFFLQRSTDTQSLKAGAQTVVWGENEGNSVLDIINTSEFRDLTIIDIEDARLNQWLVVWDRYGDNNHLSTFVNLYPEFNPPPVRGSPFFFEPAFNLSDYDREKPLFEIGSRLRWSFTGSDVAIMAAWLYENQLRYAEPPSGSGDALARTNEFLLLGLSANRAIGRLLLKLDIAYSHDILADITSAPLAPGGTSSLFQRRMNQLGASAGFEYAIDNEQNISLGVSAQSILDKSGQLQPGEFLAGDRISGNALMRYTNSLRNGDMLLAVTLQSALDAATVLASVAVNYTLTDNLALMSQMIATRADKKSALAIIHEDVRVGVTLSWTF